MIYVDKKSFDLYCLKSTYQITNYLILELNKKVRNTLKRIYRKKIKFDGKEKSKRIISKK